MEFVNVELEHYNHKVGINFWHFEWVTKYRYQMFSKFMYKNLCEACIRKVAKRHNIKILVMSVMPDHVHALVTLPKGMNDEKALQLLKGGVHHIFSFVITKRLVCATLKGIFGVEVVVL